MSSQFEAKYHELVDAVSSIKDHYDEIDQHVKSLPSFSKNDEIVPVMSKVTDILSSVHGLIEDYSEGIDHISTVIEKMSDDEEAKKRLEQEKLAGHLSSTTNNGLPLNKASLVSSLKKVETKYKYALGLAVERVKVVSQLDNSTPVSPATNQGPSPPVVDHTSTIAVPPMRIEPFDGHDITLWQGYYYQIKTIILENHSLSDPQKACCVRSSLKGDALALIASIPISDNYLSQIMTRLRSQYENESMIQTKLVKSLLSIKSKSNRLSDQLAAVQSMISLAHSIDPSCGLNNQFMQARIVGNISPRFIDKTYKIVDQTMMSTLVSIETDLMSEIDKIEYRTAMCSLNQSQANSPADSSKSNRASSSSNDHSSKPSQTTTPSRFSKQSKNPPCVFCEKHEYSSSCTEVVSAKDRKKILDKKALCHCCFSSSHPTKDCKKPVCPTCKGKHHKSLCEAPPNSVRQFCINSEAPFQLKTRLFTAPVVLANPEAHQSSMANVLLDTGSQLSLISRDLASKLHLKPVSQIETSITGLVDSHDPNYTTKSHDVVRFDLMTSKGTYSVRAVVRDTSSIVGSIQCQPLSETDLATIRDKLSTIPNHLIQSSVCPDLLLGVNDSLKLLDKAKSTQLPCGYHLVESMIGTFVAGASEVSVINPPIPPTEFRDQSNSLKASSVISTPEETLEQKIERMFSVDPSSRIYETTEKEARKEADNYVTEHFEKTVERRDDGYYVQYALKENVISELPSNHDLAVSRLASSVSKLSKDMKLLQFYDSVIKDQRSLGQVEEVDISDSSGPIHYLAHQAVLRLDKATTPLRIVYDASAHLKNKPSLNDAIHPGPTDLENIPSLLIRSRSRKGLIVADVEKAFLQVKLHPSQRNLLRFIWLKDLSKPVSNHNLLYLRFTVTPFGVNQSPCLLSKVINHHIKHNSADCDSNLVNQLISNIYVDNIIINADDPMEYKSDGASPSIYSESKRLFNEMSMNLRDYASNIHSFVSSIPEQDRSKDTIQKLLGLRWNIDTDQISINIPESTLNEKETRRTMLSIVSSPYDPLGLVNPLVLPARVTVQSLWKVTPKWDEVVNEEIRDTFHSQIRDIEKFSLSIDRNLHLSESDTITLIAFSDASNKAMAACVYSWASTYPPSLVISKYRLAPIKSPSTIPKMELEGLLMAHSLLEYTVASLRKEFPTHKFNIYSYTDSAIVLHWLKPNFTKSVGTFVANRVKKIQTIGSELSESGALSYNHPRHVRSEDNPADFATRGLSSAEMNDPTHQWWVGPNWLRSQPDSWPNPHLSDLQCPLVETSLRVGSIVNAPPPELVIDLTRHSSLTKAINVTAFVYRFIAMCAKKTGNATSQEQLAHIPSPSSISLSAVERKFAFHSLIRLEQTMASFTDKPLKKGSLVFDESIRVHRLVTRLNNSDQSSDFKSPIYIPAYGNSPLIRLIIRDVHLTSLHASTDIVLNSLKSKYFIPRVRPLVKSVLRQCVSCRKTNNLPFKYPKSPPLPSDRVRRSIPFEHTGIDNVGPFVTKDQGKQWIAIFTCFSTRLTHLECVSSLLPSSFINAFRRFCSRRGTPCQITTDNATTFRMSSTLLTSILESDEINTLFSTSGIHWSFTTAHSPWKGGIYERLIKILKESFSRSIGQKKLSKEEFDTVMCEAESLLNSRPLTYIASDEISSFSGPSLRPIDLILPDSFLGCHLNLLGSNDEYIPPNEENLSRENAIKQLSKSLAIVDNFWKRWSEEYLTTLRDTVNSSDPLQSSRGSPITPRVGSIVLIVDESGNTPRSTWKMARITSLTDTSATLKSQTGRMIERPINLLIPLEIQSELGTEIIPTTELITEKHSMSGDITDDMEELMLTEKGITNAEQFTNILQSVSNQSVTRLENGLEFAIENIKASFAEELYEFKESIKESQDKSKELQDKQAETMSVMSNQIKDMQKALNALVAQTFQPKPPVPKTPVPTPVPEKPIVTTPVASTLPPFDPTALINILQTYSQSSPATSTLERTFPKKGRTENTKSHPYQRKDGHLQPSVQCAFCQSTHHMSRDCNVVKSVNERRKAIGKQNRCPRCIRPLNHAHHPTCKPDACRRGCVDDYGKPLLHMDHLCPLNPALAP